MTARGELYRYLYPKMTDAERTAVEDALWNHCVLVSLKDNPEAKRLKSTLGWISGKNNWSPVCHSGVIAAALVAGDRDPATAAKVIHRAVVNLPISMRASYSPNGAYPEGPGYWAYGSEFNCIALGLLEHAFGTDYGLSDIPGWSTTGAYISYVTTPTGKAYSYSDSGSGVSADLPWFFLESHYPGSIPLTEPILKNLQRQSNSPANVKYSPTYKMDELRSNRLRPLELLWLKPQKPIADRPLWYYSGDTSTMPLAIFRSSWGKDATYLGIKGGGPKAPHGHMDAGSFLIEADGVRWTEDLGMQSYHPLEARGMDLWNSSQGSDRWTVFRIGPDSHNIVRINGEPLLVNGWSKIIKLQTGKVKSATLELATRYKNLKSFTRTAALNGKVVTVQDALTMKSGDTLRFQFCTKADVKIDGNSMVLALEGKTMTVSVTGDLKWNATPEEVWLREWDSDNGDAKMVWFEVTAPQNGKVDYTVTFTPGSVK